MRMVDTFFFKCKSVKQVWRSMNLEDVISYGVGGKPEINQIKEEDEDPPKKYATPLYIIIPIWRS